MIFEIAITVGGAIAGGIAGSVATHALDRFGGGRKDGGQKESLLPGHPLTSMQEYPVVERNDGSIELDLERLRAACRTIIKRKNLHAAADLLYLAEQNPDAVQRSIETFKLVQRVEKRFRRQLRHVDAVKDQRKNLLEPLINMTHGLGQAFRGLPIEFVLHDIRDPLHSIRAIENSITGRTVDSPLTNWALKELLREAKSGTPFIHAAYRVNMDGRILKATTIPIKHRVFGLIAFMCINVETKRFDATSPDLADLLRALIDTPGGDQNEVFR